MSKKTTREEIEKFVKENLVPANDAVIACADGRYNPEQSQGAIRAFGADMGMVMAIGATLKDMELLLPPYEIVERYLDAKRALLGDRASLDYHCDSHSHEKGDIGCGHIAKAANPANEGLYGSITPAEVNDLFDAFTQNPNSRLTVLEGPHEEEGVIFVYGGVDSKVNFSVNSKGDKKKRSFFVTDPTRTDNFIDSISKLISEGLDKPINPQDVKDNYALQMGTTAKLLGADKLPWYKAAVSENGHFTLEQLSSNN